MSMPASQAEIIALQVIRLRRQMENGTVEPWAGPLPAGLDTRPLHHLPPPAPVAGRPPPGDRRVAQWQAAFRPGLCYYRTGPGFIQVKDIRDPASAARIIIDQQPLIDAFLACCERPVPASGQDGASLAAVQVLLAEQLLLQFGELVTAAPYHMRCWPIPARLA